MHALKAPPYKGFRPSSELKLNVDSILYCNKYSI